MDLRDESEDEYGDYDSEEYSLDDCQFDIKRKGKDMDEDQSYDDTSQEDYYDYDEEE